MAGALGCGGPRLVGSECASAADCSGDAVPLAAPQGCGVRFTLASAQAAPGVDLDRCELFTLDGLRSVGSSDRVYITATQALTVPTGHHLDVRIAPEVEGFADGPVECTRLWARAVAWVPLMATQGETNTWDFGGAPLATARGYRLLIDDHFANSGADPVELHVQLDLTCASARPARVSQAFEFSNREPKLVAAGAHELISGSCVFQKELLVSRLYRWTHLITSYSVWRLDQQQALWRSGTDYTLDPQPPLGFAAGEGLRWECEYDNAGDAPFEIGGNSSDTCSLLGLYELASGEEDSVPERCTL